MNKKWLHVTVKEIFQFLSQYYVQDVSVNINKIKRFVKTDFKESGSYKNVSTSKPFLRWEISVLESIKMNLGTKVTLINNTHKNTLPVFKIY